MADTDLVRDQDELEEDERRRLAAARGMAAGPDWRTGHSDLELAEASGRAPNAPAKRTVDAAPPDLAPIAPPSSSGGLAPIAASTSRPSKPTAQAGSIADTQNRLDELQWQKDHPWGTPGSAHSGTLGKIGRVAGTVGNIAGDVFAPNVMARIPGTQLHRDLTEQALETRLGQQQREASEEGLRNIQEQNLQSEIEARRNPKPKLLPGEENVATDAQGNRYQRYEMPDQSTTWAAEGTVPTIGPRSAPTATLTGLAPIGAPSPGASPLPTQPAAGGLPAGATVGKPQKQTEQEADIQKYLKDNKLPDTFENRQRAETELKEGAAIGDDRAKQYTGQIAAALKGTDIDAGAYKVTKDSKTGDAKEALSAAQKAASEWRTLHAPDKKEAQKDAHTMGYAVDENGQLIYTNKAEADKRGATFEEMKPDAVNKDRQSLRQLNDIQKNISAYNKALAELEKEQPPSIGERAVSVLKDPFNLPGAVGLTDNRSAMRRILAGVNESDVQKMGYLTMGAAMDMMEHGEVADAWKKLTLPERNALIGYLRAKGAMIAYNRVVSGSARTNKEALEVEWNNLPLPYVGLSSAGPQMKAMQENLDQVNMGFPTNLPGMRNPQQVQKETEGTGSAPAVPTGAKIRNYNPATGQLE